MNESYRSLTIPEKTLRYAMNFIGLQEIKGDTHNPKILEMFEFIGHKWIRDDETHWCSCFINYVSKKMNLTHSGKLNAKSWLDIGENIKHPFPGDIVVFWRESKDSWKGHVGIYVGHDEKGNIRCLGGNQSNEVCIDTYSKDRLLGFRRLFRL